MAYAHIKLEEACVSARRANWPSHIVLPKPFRMSSSMVEGVSLMDPEFLYDYACTNVCVDNHWPVFWLIFDNKIRVD